MKMPEKKKSMFKLPRVFTREGFGELRKTEEFKNFKYFFSPNMNDLKYLIYNAVLILFIFVLYVVYGR